MKSQKTQQDIIKGRGVTLYELLWLYIGTVSLSGVVLLWLSYYSAPKALLSGLIISFVAFFLLRWKIEIPKVKMTKLSWIFVLIVIIGFAMRLSPWMYLEGGQDEGTYVSMSKQFDRSGSLQFDDITKDWLKNEDKERYQRENGWKILGVRMNEDGKLYHPFYPLHPMLMSVSGYLLGENNMVYSLTLFAILSIVGIFLLTRELSRSTLAGTIAASLLAFSPLHLYFSRFSVTEVMALAITINAFYFMLCAYKYKRWTNLFLSVLLINMFLYTRITWIISIPFYYALLLALFTYVKDIKEKMAWGIWGCSILVTYLLSLYFYYTQVNDLYVQFYHDIFEIIPEKIFYILIALIPFSIWFLTTKFRNITSKILELMFKYRNVIMYGALILLVSVNLWFFYRMAFTKEYLGTLNDTFWGMANAGWITFKDTTLLSLILYLTPVGIVLFILSIKKVINTPTRVLLMVFFLLFLTLNLVVNKFTPYHFYYARYQLSEIIPIVYIFISIYLAYLLTIKKTWFYLCLGFLTFYNVFFSAFQYQGYVGTRPDMFLEIKETVSSKDLIFYHDPTKWGISFIVSPMKYFYNIPTVIAKRIPSLDGYLSSTQTYDFNRYILSTVVLERENLEFVRTFKFVKGYYASTYTNDYPLTMEVNDVKFPYCNRIIPEKYCAGIIPLKYHKGTLILYLYKIK